MTKIQLIGGGRMGQALVHGMVDAQWVAPDQLAIVEVVAALREDLATRYPSSLIIDRPLDDVPAVVAVKPHLVAEVCRELQNPGRILSVAAGITIETMEAALPAGTAVVRAMPNTPALVGAGAAGLAGGTNATEDDVAWAVGILSSVGEAVVVTEPLLDAVTGVSGSGPAYLFLIAEALTDAGVARGLTRDVAGRLAHQTIYGAGKLLVESGDSPVDLRAGVTTPAGTTAAGLGALEAHGLRAALAAAVNAATERSVELGKPPAERPGPENSQ